MSAWTAFWALGGGGLVGLIATSLGVDVIGALLRTETHGATGGVWRPFAATEAWAQIADLATLGAAFVICGLCVQRISRDEELELRLWPATAAVIAVAVAALLTHSPWSLLAILPLAFVLRHGAHPRTAPWRWRRRATVVIAAALAYAAVLAPAFAEVQLHPLVADPSRECGVTEGPAGTTGLCLLVDNESWDRAGSVIGIASALLPRPSPWTFTVQPKTIRPGGVGQVDVGVRRASCPPGGTRVVVKAIPLRVSVGGRAETVSVGLSSPLVGRCG